MAWGRAAGSAADEWCEKLSRNDPAFTSLTVLPFRPLSEADVVALCKALHTNTRYAHPRSTWLLHSSCEIAKMLLSVECYVESPPL